MNGTNVTISLALPYTAVALLVIAMVRIHRGRQKDYWEAYNRGWDRAEETFSSIWPTDSDGEPVLPTFPSSIPPLRSQLTGSLPVGPKQSVTSGTKGHIPGTKPLPTIPPLKAPRLEAMKGQAVATKERTDGPPPAKAPKPPSSGPYFTISQRDDSRRYIVDVTKVD